MRKHTKLARDLEERTGWTYATCLYFVQTKTPDEIAGMVKEHDDHVAALTAESAEIDP